MNFADLLAAMRELDGTDYPETMFDDFEAAHSAAITNADAAHGELEAQVAELTAALTAAQADNYRLMKKLEADAGDDTSDDTSDDAGDDDTTDDSIDSLFEEVN